MVNLKDLLIVVVDDALRQTLVEQLRLHEEFGVTEVETASAALDLAKSRRFDLMLLDVGLPDMDGRELCKAMRRHGLRMPIIMLTAAAGEADTILGLESGANDYVTKPFKLGVLLARVRAQLRNHEQSEDAEFTIGPYSFRPAQKMLVRADKKIRLTDKETSILRFLLRAGTRPVGRDVLLEQVWGYNAGVTTHTLETHIYRLRQKIEADPGIAKFLVTEPGGYMLNP